MPGVSAKAKMVGHPGRAELVHQGFYLLQVIPPEFPGGAEVEADEVEDRGVEGGQLAQLFSLNRVGAADSCRQEIPAMEPAFAFQKVAIVRGTGAEPDPPDIRIFCLF